MLSHQLEVQDKLIYAVLYYLVARRGIKQMFKHFELVVDQQLCICNLLYLTTIYVYRRSSGTCRTIEVIVVFVMITNYLLL